MFLEIPYGADYIRAEIPWGQCLDVLDIAEVSLPEDLDAEIRNAIEQPIGLNKTIFEIVQPGETVCIVVSDSFRHTAIDEVLPYLIDGLNVREIPDESISFLFSTGTHRAPTPDEQAKILGPTIAKRFRDRLYNHDAYDAASMENVGTTSRGTSVEINRIALDADRVIATGAVVLHYFGGFGGGRKALVPGIASAKTIAHNHSLNLDPDEDRLNQAVQIGVMYGNPVAEDMLEAAKMMRCDYVINTVLNRKGHIAKVFAGDLVAAHEAACAFAKDVFTTRIEDKADLVIAASAPTKNFVQTHKALYNAYQAVKPDGRIILAAPCPEGLGSEQFTKWLKLKTPKAVIAALRKESEINGQTALSTLQKGPITTMVTGMTMKDVRQLRAGKASSLQTAIDESYRGFKERGIAEPTYYVMPSAAYTVPILE